MSKEELETISKGILLMTGEMRYELTAIRQNVRDGLGVPLVTQCLAQNVGQLCVLLGKYEALRNV